MRLEISVSYEPDWLKDGMPSGWSGKFFKLATENAEIVVASRLKSKSARTF
jgi:hypothetical protein